LGSFSPPKSAEREQLAAIAGDRNRPRKHVDRAPVVLASADRHSAQRVAQGIGRYLSLLHNSGFFGVGVFPLGCGTSRRISRAGPGP
jgi:hypothetical protein